MSLELAKELDPSGKERKLRWESMSRYNKWESLLGESDLEIDLSGFTILGHDGLIWLAYLSLVRQEKPTRIILPQDDDQIQWLMALGFIELQQNVGFRFSNEYIIPQQQTKYLYKDRTPLSLRKIQPITQNNWSHIANAASIYVNSILPEYLNISPYGQIAFEDIAPFAVTVTELIHNIALHSGPESGRGTGLVAYTPWPKRIPVIRFCCNDIGAGYKNTLENKEGIKCSDDVDAIVEALLFRFLRPMQGIIGLYKTLDFIRMRRGRLGIRTGTALVELDLRSDKVLAAFNEQYHRPEKNWLRDLLRITEVSPIPGTHIFVDLHL